MQGSGRRGELRKPGRRSERKPDASGRAVDASLVFGTNPVLELLRSRPNSIRKISVASGARESRLDKIFELSRAGGVLIEKVPREVLDRLTDLNHQGVIAHIAASSYSDPEEIFDGASYPELLVLLDGIEDPRNLGAILRTAEAAGSGGVFITERRSVGLTETAAKTSAGAVEYIKVAKVPNMNRLIEDMRSRNIWVVGAAGEAEMAYTEWDWSVPTALVLGSEGAGLHRLVAENCDALVHIPMYGKIGSLNVSVAAGVILFEAMRQRALKALKG